MSASIKEILADNAGIKLDIGCGARRQDGFVGIDIRPGKGVDIVHDLEEFPWPLPDECVVLAIASHVVEHINPHKGVFIRFMDEVWRVLRPDCQFAISTPYWLSPGYAQDPTHCFLPDTEVLTDHGFRPIPDVSIGDGLISMNPATQKSEIVSCVGTVNVPYDGDMLHFRHNRMDMAVTPNHSLYFASSGKHQRWRMDRADSFVDKSRKSRVGLATIQWDGPEPERIAIPRVKRGGNNAGRKLPIEFDASDFMSFMGWYLSEGCVYKRERQYTITIYQSKSVHPKEHSEIVRLIKRMGFSPVVRDDGVLFSSKDMYSYLEPLGHSADKYIPQEIKALGPDLLKVMLRSLLMGDGTANGRSHTYASISKQLADDVQEIALKCGYRSTRYEEHRSDRAVIRGDEVNQSPIMYYASVCPVSLLYYATPSIEPYKGDVVCVTAAKHHTIMVRRNGRVAWAGNCNPCNESTWLYFDPLETQSNGLLYSFYKPKPWKLDSVVWDVAGNMEVVLRKRRIDKSYGCEVGDA